jgi:hypothetical protein
MEFLFLWINTSEPYKENDMAELATLATLFCMIQSLTIWYLVKQWRRETLMRRHFEGAVQLYRREASEGVALKGNGGHWQVGVDA